MIKEVKYQGEIWSQCSCDNCGEIAENGEGFTLMPDELSSSEMAMELGWERLTNGVHYCPDCIIDEEE